MPTQVIQGMTDTALGEASSDWRAFNMWELRRGNALDPGMFAALARATDNDCRGYVKGLVRVIDNTNDDAAFNKVFDRKAAYTGDGTAPNVRQTSTRVKVSREVLPFPVDVHEVLKPTTVIVRAYIIEGSALAAMDRGNSSDPYIVAKLGNEVQGKKKEERRVITDSLNPYWGQVSFLLDHKASSPGGQGSSGGQNIIKDH